jgi:allantoin racemase
VIESKSFKGGYEYQFAKSLKLKVINPITSGQLDAEEEREMSSYAFPGTQITLTHLDFGPESIECELDEALCVPDFLRQAEQAEAEGYDAVISNCFGDPGVKAAREILNIPVVGAAEASMHFASCLGQRFSVVTTLRNFLPLAEDLAAQYGLEKKLASVRFANIPVLGLEEKGKLVEALHKEMIAAIQEDGAHVLVLGCTGMTGVAKKVESLLKEDGYEVPVVNAAAACLKLAEVLVSMGLKQSRLTSMRPPNKVRSVFPALLKTETISQ